ncbi:DUF5683 domain-containing protein [Prevotella dentasini]|uniref:DUF5683 domain-containing protein n=1 Tax=Prevotella dentasini TaxID=589537 RepID=UPI001F44196E|nr:DUF5683 domain-containing protein [Prevotella dentasini]
MDKLLQRFFRTAFVLWLVLCGATEVLAQVPDRVPDIIYPDDSVAVEQLDGHSKSTGDSVAASPDEAELVRALEGHEVALKIRKQRRDWSTWRPSPKKALWLSLIPGGGQIYNRKYWKLPIFYGGFLGCIYAWSWNNQTYRDYSQAYLDIMDGDPSTQSYNDFLHLGITIDESNVARYQSVFKKRKDRYRRWRDMSIFATVAVYALSIIDAYVDASLSEFDISDELSLRVSPTVIRDQSPGGSHNLFGSTALGVGCSLVF